VIALIENLAAPRTGSMSATAMLQPQPDFSAASHLIRFLRWTPSLHTSRQESHSISELPFSRWRFSVAVS